MRVLAEHAEKIRMNHHLEPVTYTGHIITTSDDVRWALDEVNSPRFKCMPDQPAHDLRRAGVHLL